MSCDYPDVGLSLALPEPPSLDIPELPEAPDYSLAAELGITGPSLDASLSLATPEPPSLDIPELPEVPDYSLAAELGIDVDASISLAPPEPPSLDIPELPISLEVACPFDEAA